MATAKAREPEDSRQEQAQFTADLICLANQLRTARALPQRSAAERQKRLDQVRAALANGTYKIDSAAIGKAIMRRKLL